MLLLLVSMVLLLVAGWNMQTLAQQTAQVQEDLSMVNEHDSAPVERARPSATPEVTPTQAVSINTAIKKLNVPWEKLLDSLEEASNPKVALIELRPDIVSQQLVGVAEAGTSDAMFAYVHNLKRQPMLTTAHLTNHQVSEQDRNKPIRFEFTATWRESQP
jgi:Tfp pilus assembly protein PilN